MSTIRVYQTVPPAVIENHQYDLAGILTGLPPADTDEYFLAVDHQGFIAYRHHKKLSTQQAVSLEAGLEENALQAARTFIERSSKALKEAGLARLPSLFPRSYKAVRVEQMIRGGQIQFWNCEFSVLLRPSNKDKVVPVEAANFDILVGTNMEILGFKISWRSIERTKQTDRLPILFDEKLVLAYEGEMGDGTWIRVNGSKEPLQLSLFYRFDHNRLLILPWYEVIGNRASLYGELPATEQTISAISQ